jgi:RNA recognition motif-containing protein
MPVRLFVGNLPYEATEAEIREHFGTIGTVTYCYLPTDRETGRPRGFAFVEYADDNNAQQAIARPSGSWWSASAICGWRRCSAPVPVP